MAYQVGDVVTIRKDLEAHRKYNGLYCASGMLKYSGRTATIATRCEISKTRTDYKLTLSDAFWWTDEMFEDEPVCESVSLDISELL